MKEKESSFLGLAENIFYNFSQIKPGSLNLVFSKRTIFPVIKYDSELEIIIPLPRKQNGKYLFEGMLYDDNFNERQNLWCLFLATIYHLAAHACVSGYSIYDSWKRSKTEDICLRVIDYIEDMFVEQYISHTDYEIWKSMKNIENELMSKNQKNSSKSFNVEHPKIFGLSDKEKIAKIRTNVMHKQNDVILFANLLYKNRELLSREIMPYYERHDVQQMLETGQKSPDFKPNGVFQENTVKLDDLWLKDAQLKLKILGKYKKNLKDLNFDSIVVPRGNFYNFLQIKEKISPLLRKIHQQMRMVGNNFDDPKTDERGYLNMQMVIQSMASESQSVDVFERDEIRRVEEAWVILIDNSASMGLRFEQIKEFTVCIAEAANDLTGKSDAWALFSFDNNFKILKDFEERYDHEVQARIGSLKNNGLSLLPDAIELARRVLLNDARERKYIFLITDGHPSGYEKINHHLVKITKKLDASGVSLIAIGVSKSTSKHFRHNVRGSSNLGQLVAKFITAYKTVSSD
ncbi:putative von Willebrand factor A [Nitrosotalea devaniterrae]|uniref:Putative von Willebrand factor A n=1 Tax=Nitrosotalea devaniterrae TaxID=1078905 RepID=A0A128A342_9ARCH|nr:putative von Willebrand factor A [Candidatus Nitrosotalea devanaterra]